MAGKAMEKRMIGSSDMNVSVIALGCFSFGGDHTQGSQMGASFAKLHTGVWGEQKDEDTTNCIAAALKNGINFFDTAEMYGDGYSEEVMGRAFKEIGAPRSSYYLATKVSEANLEPKKLREHLEASLARLQTDYVDLYQIHWHSRAGLRSERYPDRPLTEEVPLADTLAELSKLQKEGKIRHIGVCNFGVEDLKAALATGVPPPENGPAAGGGPAENTPNSC